MLLSNCAVCGKKKSTFIKNHKVSNDQFKMNKIINKFEMKTVNDYHDLYLKRDVLLLANVFEKFRNNSLKNMDYVQVII